MNMIIIKGKDKSRYKGLVERKMQQSECHAVGREHKYSISPNYAPPQWHIFADRDRSAVFAQ